MSLFANNLCCSSEYELNILNEWSHTFMHYWWYFYISNKRDTELKTIHTHIVIHGKSIDHAFSSTATDGTWDTWETPETPEGSSMDETVFQVVPPPVTTFFLRNMPRKPSLNEWLDAIRDPIDRSGHYISEIFSQPFPINNAHVILLLSKLSLVMGFRKN